jgi:hypothetical protein
MPRLDLILILGLVSYRISRFITTDAVPLGNLRDRLLDHFNRAERTLLVEGLTCDWCISVWASGLLVGLLNWLWIPLPLPFLDFFAVSSIAGVVSSVVRRLDRE